uniref:C2H2-type domain-containing protein n=1 Tax=Globodera pallida TaxID=36090 RepID=A0A183C620_GLOPA
MFSAPTKTRWTCRQCMKSLCSKRSYDEHMNIHNKIRPFVCEDCDYAAASQMTLTRHRQRRHTPRQEWHYQCPYCGEPYMEPASYRQHVLARHYGHSATFGCPYGDCPFKCKSSKAFRDHLRKHQAVIVSRASTAHVQSPRQQQFDLDNLAMYMVDDEWVGNLTAMPRKFAVLYGRATAAACAIVSARPQHAEAVQRRRVKVLNGMDELLGDDDAVPLLSAQQSTTLPLSAMNNNEKEAVAAAHRQQWHHHQKRDQGVIRTDRNIGGTVEEPHHQQFVDQLQQTTDWIIETEVVIEEPMNAQMPDGQTDDFGLD